MSPLTAILLLAIGAPTNAEGDAQAARASASSAVKVLDAEPHFPGATEVQKCTFEPTRDEDTYGWPPGWTRRHGPGFPRYVRVRVDDERPPPGGRCVHVELNGGAASAFGPSITVTPGVDFVLEGYIKTAGLRHDAAWLSLTFLDSARAKLSEATSAKISGDNAWQKVCIGPLTPPADASLSIIGIHVAPQGDDQDLHGTASFGSLWVGRLPRVTLTARTVEPIGRQTVAAAAEAEPAIDAPKPASLRNTRDASFMVFARGKPIEVACLVSGFVAPKYEMHLQLEDADGRKLAEHKEDFSTTAPPNAATSASKNADRAGKTVPALAGNSARTTWQIPNDVVGYYRVRARIDATDPSAGTASQSNSPPPHSTRADIGLAIIDPEMPAAQSEFGWSLDPNDIAVGLVPMGDLLGQSGIRWVKFPFICAEAKRDDRQNAAAREPRSKHPEPDRIEPLISLSDRLADAGVRLVGVLLPHPPAAEAGLPAHDVLAVEAFAAEPKTWYPSIEPVLARLATEIRYWQIGDDRDPGWIDCRDLSAAVSRVKTELDRIGQNVNVGVAWNLDAPLPMAGARTTASDHGADLRQTPWRFFSLPCDAAMTDAELAARLDGMASAHFARWLAIDALPRDGNSDNRRIAQLVGRMLTAKMHSAEGIYFAHPFDAVRGLVGRDGSPSALFLPWRTAALMLGGMPYAGDIDLAGGNRIHCFGSRGNYVGAIAGGSPRPESIYLGDNLHSRDVWGHAAALRPAAGIDSSASHAAPEPVSTIDIQQLPIFLSGLDASIAEWQLNVAFAPKSLLSIPNSIVPVALEIKNPLPRAVSGRVRIAGPRNWFIAPQIAEFRIDAGEAWKLPLQMALANDVVSGRQMVALDFEIQSDRIYHFTMYRSIEITLGDIAFDGRARVTERGEMEVRQTLANQGKRAARFRCDLLAPDRRRQSTDIVLQPFGKSEFSYRLPYGRDLLGKPLWLRAEEIDGPRVLNYRLEASSEDK